MSNSNDKKLFEQTDPAYAPLIKDFLAFQTFKILSEMSYTSKTEVSHQEFLLFTADLLSLIDASLGRRNNEDFKLGLTNEVEAPTKHTFGQDIAVFGNAVAKSIPSLERKNQMALTRLYTLNGIINSLSKELTASLRADSRDICYLADIVDETEYRGFERAMRKFADLFIELTKKIDAIGTQIEPGR